MNTLSSDVIQKIFEYLIVRQIYHSSRVNCSFSQVCHRESLWKSKLHNDYGVDDSLVGKTWRVTAKVISFESEMYWYFIEREIKYFKTEVLTREVIDEFERNLISRALKERKEMYVVKLMFMLLFDVRYRIDDIDDEYDKFYLNFLPLFDKIKKISLRWVLNLIPVKEIKVLEVEIKYMNPNLIDDCKYRWKDDEEACKNHWYGNGRKKNSDSYRHSWLRFNRELCMAIEPLILLFDNYPQIFHDDTTEDQDDILFWLRYHNNYIYLMQIRCFRGCACSRVKDGFI